MGVPPGGPKAEALTDIGHPRIDWISLARSFGVEAFRATTADELSRHIDAGLALQGARCRRSGALSLGRLPRRQVIRIPLNISGP